MNTTTKSQDINQAATVLHYLVKEPNITTDKTPLAILLHGVGSNEQDLFSFAGQLPGNFLVVSARAPNTLREGSYAWFQVDFSSGNPVINPQQAEKSRKLLIEFISQLKGIYSFDDKEVYLCGFSQGGIMSYSVGLTMPGLICGIAVMSGRLLEEVKPLIAPKENLQQLKVFISHGTNDNTLNIEYARAGKAFLKTLNINPTYKEYLHGHGINNEMLLDLVNWLNKK